MTTKDFQKVHFIGVAGTGMSAIAQYLAGIGKTVTGSDRYFVDGKLNDTGERLVACGIRCFAQDGSGILPDVNLVVVSTAIEDTVPEVQKAKALNIPIVKRSNLLNIIAGDRKTIAIGGTSGKSTTSAMLYDIMNRAGYAPGIISGAGLVSLIKENKIGNAAVGNGEWLIIEADESDGSIVEYHPQIGVVLNIDKDHQEIGELENIFNIFKKNTKELFVVNDDNLYTKKLSSGLQYDFSSDIHSGAGFIAQHYHQKGLEISFTINNQSFSMQTIGKHNMENAAAAVAVASQIGISLQVCADALKSYEGIYRRHQLLIKKKNLYLIDDYAHNPVKCASSIRACQEIAPKVIAWFQPHGYGPTRFLKNDFIAEISSALREEDEIWMSEIFYAGGTAEKNISAKDLTDVILANGKKAFFVSDRNDFLKTVRPHLVGECVLLLMGARDPSLEDFAKQMAKEL